MTRNWLEWVVLAASGVALLALVGYLALAAVRDPGGPPRIEVEIRSAEATTTPTGWEVPVRVRNAGGRPALNLVLRAEADVGDGSEEAEATVDLLPADAEAEVVFGFSAEPAAAPVIHVVGFEVP